MFPHLKHTLDRNVLGISFGTGTWLSFQRPCRLDEDICTLKTCKDSLKLSKTKTKWLLKFGFRFMETTMSHQCRMASASDLPDGFPRFMSALTTALYLTSGYTFCGVDSAEHLEMTLPSQSKRRKKQCPQLALPCKYIDTWINCVFCLTTAWKVTCHNILIHFVKFCFS